MLRRIWLQNYLSANEGVRWRSVDDIPPAAQFIRSPYDPDAHLGKKGSTCWVGYKVHFTETVRQVTLRCISAPSGIDKKGGQWVNQFT